MDTSRVINIVFTEMSLENLKLQEDLELEINSPKKIDEKITAIKNTLNALVVNELMITKLQELVSDINNNKD